jgi:hypothetical protein
MRDLDNNITTINLLRFTPNHAATSYQSNTEFTGTGVDTKGEARKLHSFLNAQWLVKSPANVMANSLTVIIEESDTSVFTSVSTLGTYGAQSQTTALSLDLTPTKRYIRAKATLASAQGTSNTVSFNVWGLFYNERQRPSSVALIP